MTTALTTLLVGTGLVLITMAVVKYRRVSITVQREVCEQLRDPGSDADPQGCLANVELCDTEGHLSAAWWTLNSAHVLRFLGLVLARQQCTKLDVRYNYPRLICNLETRHPQAMAALLYNHSIVNISEC